MVIRVSTILVGIPLVGVVPAFANEGKSEVMRENGKLLGRYLTEDHLWSTFHAKRKWNTIQNRRMTVGIGYPPSPWRIFDLGKSNLFFQTDS